jgi:acetyl-CoA carboxylase biotin carboxyl carrier protein
MNIRQIKALIDLLKKNDITEIELEEGDQYIRLSRKATVIDGVAYNAPHAHAPQETHKIPEPVAEHKSLHSHGHTLKSPMVGTIYLASSPEASPFVSIGQRVKLGDTLCIVEAMKMFNEVEADKVGVISEILVSNGEAVEFNQPLFVISEA